MAGSTHKNLVIGAICLSLAAHGGFAVVAGSFGVAIGDDSTQVVREASTPLLLSWSDEPPETPEPEAPPLIAEKPEPEPEPPQPPEVDTVRLGIAESDQDTENWMGFDKPTPHAAMKSDVEQPALDPNAGAAAPQGVPGAPSLLPQPVSPPTPPAPASPAVAPPLPALPPESAEPAPPRPAAQPNEARAPQQPMRQPLDAGGTEPNEPVQDPEEDRGTLQPELPDPDEPMLLEGKTDEPALVPPLQSGFVGPPFDASDATEEAPESAEPATPAPPAPPAEVQSPPVAQPTPPSPPTPPSSPAQAGSTNPGAVPGEVSDRESDASSLDNPVEIRLGRPAAAKGLEIVTKRPEFSRLTRMTVYPPNNPRLKVTFNREGRVSEARFIEPTGLAEIDSPVLNAVYRWTAKGEALTKLPVGDPKAGISITVTILLR